MSCLVIRWLNTQPRGLLALTIWLITQCCLTTQNIVHQLDNYVSCADGGGGRLWCLSSLVGYDLKVVSLTYVGSEGTGIFHVNPGFRHTPVGNVFWWSWLAKYSRVDESWTNLKNSNHRILSGFVSLNHCQWKCPDQWYSLIWLPLIFYTEFCVIHPTKINVMEADTRPASAPHQIDTKLSGEWMRYDL